MMRMSCLLVGLMWSVLSKWPPWLQHPDWASGIWGVEKVGDWGWEVLKGRPGGGRAPQKSWEKVPPFALRDFLPPEPLPVPGPGQLSFPTKSFLWGRKMSGPAHSSHQVPRARETTMGSRTRFQLHCLPTVWSWGSTLEPQFLPLSNRANALCLIQMGMKSDEVMGVKGKGFGSERRPGPGLSYHLRVDEDTELQRGTVVPHCRKDS